MRRVPPSVARSIRARALFDSVTLAVCVVPELGLGIRVGIACHRHAAWAAQQGMGAAQQRRREAQQHRRTAQQRQGSRAVQVFGQGRHVDSTHTQQAALRQQG
jgi:hypothetical protein